MFRAPVDRCRVVFAVGQGRPRLSVVAEKRRGLPGFYSAVQFPRMSVRPCAEMLFPPPRGTMDLVGKIVLSSIESSIGRQQTGGEGRRRLTSVALRPASSRVAPALLFICVPSPYFLAHAKVIRFDSGATMPDEMFQLPDYCFSEESAEELSPQNAAIAS